MDGDGNVSKDEYLATIEGDSLLYDTFTDLITVTVRGGRGAGAGYSCSHKSRIAVRLSRQ